MSYLSTPRVICGSEPQTNDPLTAYYNGLRDGVSRFAWWKDGTQYVGTTGTTLAKALKEIEIEREQAIAVQNEKSLARFAGRPIC